MADSAVKIGLGSIIALLTTRVSLKLTHNHELKKEAMAQCRKELDVKAERYINYLSCARVILQKHKFAPFQHDSNDYIEFTRLHDIISVTAENEIRNDAFNSYNVVSQAIIMGTAQRDEKKPVHEAAQTALDIFQASANADLQREKDIIEQLNKNPSFWKFWLW